MKACQVLPAEPVQPSSLKKRVGFTMVHGLGFLGFINRPGAEDQHLHLPAGGTAGSRVAHSVSDCAAV